MKTSGQQLARAAGWFSAGLGAVAVVAPGSLAQFIGLRDTRATRAVIRTIGGQELAAAGAISSMGKPAPWMWSRVAGDAVHLGLLGLVLTTGRAKSVRTIATMGAVASITAIDAVAARRLSDAAGGTVRATGTTTINRPPDEVYGAWRDLEGLPRFMWHLESVTTGDDGRSHWKAKGPAGTTIEWDAEIVEDLAGERISWRSLEGAHVPNRGVVAFRPAPGGEGTEVIVELAYEPLGGAAGAQVAQLFGESPTQQLADDLRRFKQIVEIGEVVRSDGSPDGTRVQRQWHQEDAQPKEVVA